MDGREGRSGVEIEKQQAMFSRDPRCCAAICIIPHYNSLLRSQSLQILIIFHLTTCGSNWNYFLGLLRLKPMIYGLKERKCFVKQRSKTNQYFPIARPQPHLAFQLKPYPLKPECNYFSYYIFNSVIQDHFYSINATLAHTIPCNTTLYR